MEKYTYQQVESLGFRRFEIDDEVFKNIHGWQFFVMELELDENLKKQWDPITREIKLFNQDGDEVLAYNEMVKKTVCQLIKYYNINRSRSRDNMMRRQAITLWLARNTNFTTTQIGEIVLGVHYTTVSYTTHNVLVDELFMRFAHDIWIELDSIKKYR